MEAKDYLNDLKDIKSMMSQLTQFISLSGLSGIFAGIYALIGSYIGHSLFLNYYKLLQTAEFSSNHDAYFYMKELEGNIIIIALSVLVLSIITAYFLTVSKAKRLNEKVWNGASKKLILSFSIPLITGGIFGLLLVQNQYWNLVAPITLIFYGLACENASKYTFRDVRYLGITQIILGLICVQYPGFGLYFWAAGFGVCHIIYGGLMYFKYDRK